MRLGNVRSVSIAPKRRRSVDTRELRVLADNLLGNKETVAGDGVFRIEARFTERARSSEPWIASDGHHSLMLWQEGTRHKTSTDKEKFVTQVSECRADQEAMQEYRSLMFVSTDSRLSIDPL